MSAVGAGHACDSNIPNTITPAIPHQSCLITWGVCRLFADARPWSQAWPAPTAGMASSYKSTLTLRIITGQTTTTPCIITGQTTTL